VKVGDLVLALRKECDEALHWARECGCWFCCNESNGVGVVVERLNEKGVQHSGGYWAVMFEAGEWRLYGAEIELLSETQ